MKIHVNGQPHQLTDSLSLLALLEQLEVKRAQVAVELNGELVPREQHAAHQLVEGDAIEIVTLVGGG